MNSSMGKISILIIAALFLVVLTVGTVLAAPKGKGQGGSPSNPSASNYNCGSGNTGEFGDPSDNCDNDTDDGSVRPKGTKPGHSGGRA